MPSLRSTSPHDPSVVLAEHDAVSAGDVHKIVERAREAQREWWAAGAAKRAAALTNAAADLEQRASEATSLIIGEVGKPVAEASGEVARTVSILRYYGQASFAADGSTYPPSLGGLLLS